MDKELEQLKKKVENQASTIEALKKTVDELYGNRIRFDMPYGIRDNIAGSVIHQLGYLSNLAGASTTVVNEAIPSFLALSFLGRDYPVMVNANVTSGTGAPAFSCPKGTLYLRTDGSSVSTRAYINTDGTSTGWTSITTLS